MPVDSKVLARGYRRKDNRKKTVTKKRSWLRETPSNNFHASREAAGKATQYNRIYPCVGVPIY